MSNAAMLAIISVGIQAVMDYQAMKNKSHAEIRAMFVARFAKFKTLIGEDLPEPFLKEK